MSGGGATPRFLQCNLATRRHCDLCFKQVRRSSKYFSECASALEDAARRSAAGAEGAALAREVALTGQYDTDHRHFEIYGPR